MIELLGQVFTLGIVPQNALYAIRGTSPYDQSLRVNSPGD